MLCHILKTSMRLFVRPMSVTMHKDDRTCVPRILTSSLSTRRSLTAMAESEQAYRGGWGSLLEGWAYDCMCQCPCGTSSYTKTKRTRHLAQNCSGSGGTEGQCRVNSVPPPHGTRQPRSEDTMRGMTHSPIKPQEAPKSCWNQRTPKEEHPEGHSPCQAVGAMDR